jgi:putative ATPase
MKQLGYGKGYRYAHDEEEGVAGMDCLPEALAGKRYYEPMPRGEEPGVAERLDEARRIREEKKEKK